VPDRGALGVRLLGKEQKVLCAVIVTVFLSPASPGQEQTATKFGHGLANIKTDYRFATIPSATIPGVMIPTWSTPADLATAILPAIRLKSRSLSPWMNMTFAERVKKIVCSLSRFRPFHVRLVDLVDSLTADPMRNLQYDRFFLNFPGP
jgi:hypothetical protein